MKQLGNSGTVYDTDGSTAIQGAIVQAYSINNNQFLSSSAIGITASNGQYTIELANFSTTVSNGDLIRIIVYKPEKFATHETIVDTSVGSETKNFTLTALTYAKPSEVASLLGVRNAFTMSSIPGIVDVCEHLYNAEAYIDWTTGHAWRSVLVSNEEHTLRNSDYIHGTGRAIFLDHRAIRTFTSGTHKIEVYEGGSTYTDYVASKTEGRNSDYWLDYSQGVIFLNIRYVPPYMKDVRVTYRYGESAVPSDINMAARMIVARQLLMSDDRSVILPSGESTNLSYEQKINIWTKLIDKILSDRAEVRLAPASNVLP